MSKIMKLALALTVIAAPAMAQTWSSNAPKIGPINQPEGILVQPYNVSTNYCPTGYQPVVLGGVICCGAPNTSEAFASPPTYKPRRTYYAPMSCPPGLKGCS